MNHDQLRKAPLGNEEIAHWRAAYRQVMTVGTGACPDAEQLAALVTGEVPDNERPAIAEHVSSCTRCAESYRTLLELHAAAAGERPRAQPSQLRPRSRPRRWAALAVAAAVALALGLVVLLQPIEGPGTAGDAVRSETPPEVRPAAGSVLGAAPAELTWPPQVGTSSYRVRLFDGTGDLIWESGPVSESRLTLPSEVQSGLEVNQACFWVVRTAGPTLRQELGPFWFEIRR